MTSTHLPAIILREEVKHELFLMFLSLCSQVMAHGTPQGILDDVAMVSNRLIRCLNVLFSKLMI